MRTTRPNKPTVDELLPLRLVGDFCSWQVEVPGLELSPCGSLVGGKVLEYVLQLQLEESSLEFQVVSSPLGFKVRLYPKGDGLVKAEDKMGASEANAAVGGCNDGHGRNFRIQLPQAGDRVCVLVRLALGSKGVQGAPIAAQVTFAKSGARAATSCVSINDGKLTVIDSSGADQRRQVAWSSDPQSQRLPQLLPLRLVGQPCNWRLEQAGLLFSAIQSSSFDAGSGWQGHCLCLRLLTRQVDFQIVSGKLGFGWRLFPESSVAGRIKECGRCPDDCTEMIIGGKDDGAGLNFVISGRPLNVITIYVWLKVREDKVAAARIGYMAPGKYHPEKEEETKPKVAVGARRVQYPVPQQMTPLGPEILEAAETEEEKKAALEQRNDCIRRAAWRLQEEYAAEDVQREILALRQLYPYQQKKSILALEMEGEKRRMQEDAEKEPDDVQRYVEAAQALKQQGCEDAHAEAPTMDAGLAPVPDGHPGPQERVSEEEHPQKDDAKGRTVEEELRFHCRAGLAAVQRQVAQHSYEDDGSKPEGSTLALLPQNHPSALAGALAMCAEDAIASAMAGAREAHLAQLRKQEKILSHALQPLEQSEDEGDEVDANKSLALLQKPNLFGDTDAQFNSALQNLPAVKAARDRAMRALGLPESLAPTAARMTELLHDTDRTARASNMLSMKRLRLIASPHPSINGQAAEALRSRGVLVGSPATWFFGMEGIQHQFPAVLEELSKAANAGVFNHWFGGPRAGRYAVVTAEELWQWGMVHVFETLHLLQDQLQMILNQLGEEGRRLRVEQQMLISFHGKGQQLPPWEDGAGRRSRRVSLVWHPSYSHRRVVEGGAFRIHPVRRDGRKGDMLEIPGGGGSWAIFRTTEFRQEVTKVTLPCGRWSITVCAEDREVAQKLRPENTALAARTGDLAGVDAHAASHLASREVSCDCCHFAAGDGLQLSCPGSHRLCRSCLLIELRRESVPTCPACAGEGDRIHLSSRWELMDQAHAALDELGCCCTPGAEGCDSQIDVGAQVIIFGQSKSSGLNGQRAQTLWWDFNGQFWEVLVLASRQVMAMHSSEIALAEACGGTDGLNNCPCWPSGRGLYPVSLGNRCCVKLGIDECSGDAHCPVGYPYFHGAEYLPFDSLLTSLDAVLHFLRHDFANFFHYNDMINVHPPGLPNIIFHNYRSWMHTFPHHHPQSDQAKLDRRIRRFRVLCRHSRDVRGSRPLLFVRYVGDSPTELLKLEDLYSILRLWGGSRARLCFVAMLQARQPPQPHLPPPGFIGRSASTSGLSAKSIKGGRLFRHDVYPKVLFWLVDGLVNVMDFGPIRQALRFNVYDEAGLLYDVPSISTSELMATLLPFKDPYTNKSENCDRTWLERPPAKEREIALGFFPDCPRAQQPHQGCQANSLLRSAVRSGDVVRVRELLRDSTPADANSWDDLGRRPLHDLCETAATGRGQLGTLRLAAELMLAHGDPRAQDKAGKAALDLARSSKADLGSVESTTSLARKPFLRELTALLAACSLQGVTEDGFADPAGLFRALEYLGEPLRSQIALGVLGLAALRPIGPAEMKWRNPGPGLEEQLAALDDELAAVKRLKETSQRRRALRRLLFEWHPDKNAHRHELAKAAFQHIQMQKAAILEKGQVKKG